MNIGIDIGGTNIKGVLLKNNRVVARKKTSTRHSKNQVLTRVFDFIEKFSEKGKIDKIGIGIPGPTDFYKQKTLSPINIRSLDNLYLGKIIKEKFNIKTIIDNDVNCFALAEAILGAGKKKSFVVGLTLGTGLGGGIVINKKLYRGANNIAGEFAYTIIDNNKTLGSYVDEDGMLNITKMIFDKKVELEELHSLAKRGNSKAIKTWKIIGEYLGIGLANIVNVLDPDIIVIGGGISNAGNFLFKPAIKKMKDNVCCLRIKNTPVVRSKLGDYAGAIGAALLR